jgi:signal transduction histidine kinase
LLRGHAENLVFILVSNSESTSSAITQGANLLIRENEIHELPLILASLIVKKKQHESDIELSNYSFPGIGEDEISELQKKNEELEKINFELDRFVYSASHDLRAPLTSVMGLLYLLREEEKQEGTLRLIGLMEESINKLDNTIRDIVAYSRNNRTELIIEPLRIQPLIENVIGGLRYLESNDYTLPDSILAEDEGVFLGDKSRLSIILNNLISNALRFRHPARKPEIVVKVHKIGSSLEITVSDNGIGINDHHLDKIFNMFYRTSDHSAGSGLGLYIVRETVKKMEGSIEVKSTVNQGTTFRISLPLQWNNLNKS